eukprot:ANDGO_07818.mRNA.1 Geranylgeranyl transferase type-2 subunit alpha
MHGVKRSEYIEASKDEARKAVTQQKIAKLTELSKTALAMRKSGDYSDHALAVSAQVLLLNSDFYTMWNFRKDILASRLALHRPFEACGPQAVVFAAASDSKAAATEAETEAEDRSLRVLMYDEMALLEKCIQRHFKSYPTWHHRRWVIARLSQLGDLEVIPREIGLCDKLLKADDRNFHVWNHRRTYAPLDAAFARAKINSNFSNYSAWHQRALCIQHGVERVTYAGEVELLQNAWFTEPKDQAAWVYHLFLLRSLPRTSSSSCSSSSMTTTPAAAMAVGEEAGVEEERTRDICRQVIEVEDGGLSARWARLTLVCLGEVGNHVQVLEQQDPVRKNFYAYLATHSAAFIAPLHG